MSHPASFLRVKTEARKKKKENRGKQPEKWRGWGAVEDNSAAWGDFSRAHSITLGSWWSKHRTRRAGLMSAVSALRL